MGRKEGRIQPDGAMLYPMLDRDRTPIAAALTLRTLAVAAALSVAAPAGNAIAREPAPQAAAQKASADTIAVDFYAVAADGLPIGNLKAEEVQLKIDGRARPVKWLEWIPLAELPAGEPSAAPPAPIPAPYGTNAERDAGRTFVIAIENESFRPGRERPLRDAVEKFLSALSPRDRVGLVTMPYGGFRVQPTNDLARVRAELAKVGGQGSSNESGSEMACRTRRTLESLVGLVSGFGALEGPTNVMFVTSGMAGPRRDAAISLAPGMCELTVDLFAQVGAAVGAARTMFFLIQPEDLMIKPGVAMTENIAGANFRGSDNPLEGIEHLAGVTGAVRLSLASTGEATLVRIARETAAYYMLGFDVQQGDRNNASRQIDIRIAREGVSVRSRPSLTIPRIENRAAVKSQSVTPRAMLREARTFRDLPLRGIGYVSHNPEDGKLKVVCLMESTEASVQLTAASAGLFDGDGRLVAQWTADAKALTGPTVMGALVVAEARHVPAARRRHRRRRAERLGRLRDRGGRADGRTAEDQLAGARPVARRVRAADAVRRRAGGARLPGHLRQGGRRHHRVGGDRAVDRGAGAERRDSRRGPAGGGGGARDGHDRAADRRAAARRLRRARDDRGPRPSAGAGGADAAKSRDVTVASATSPGKPTRRPTFLLCAAFPLDTDGHSG